MNTDAPVRQCEPGRLSIRAYYDFNIFFKEDCFCMQIKPYLCSCNLPEQTYLGMQGRLPSMDGLQKERQQIKTYKTNDEKDFYDLCHRIVHCNGGWGQHLVF